MAHYCLLLNCSTGSDPAEQEGVFDSESWVSYDGGTVVDPDTTSLPVKPGDQVAFAVQVTNNSSAASAALQWLTVIMSASPSGGNRGSSARKADNNSPFRINGKPQSFLGANINGAGGLSRFTTYNTTGTVDPAGTYLGLPYATVVADIPPGSTTPTKNVSKYEAVLVVSVTDSNQNIWQFAYDPEMDVENN